MKNAVGPVLRMSEGVEAIIAAIEEDNPGTEIEVIDRGAYVRIQAQQRMKVTRASIERHIGRPFEMRQLEPIFLSKNPQSGGRALCIRTNEQWVTTTRFYAHSVAQGVARSVKKQDDL